MALCLGTAQLGQDYGIVKKPDKATAFEILAAAFDNGVEYIDTAPMYGEAQSLIGSFLQSNGLRIRVITKIPTYRGTDNTGFVDWVKSSAINSMRTLGRGQLWAVLIHDAQNVKDFPQEIMGLRAWFVATGVVQKFGISLYETSEIGHRMMGIYQFPMNMLDSRFYRELDPYDFFWNGNTLMARSIYLRGRIEDRATSMAFVKKALSKRTKNSLIVVGCEKPEQLIENVKLYNCPEMSEDVFNAIVEESEKTPVEIIDPRRWR